MAITLRKAGHAVHCTWLPDARDLPDASRIEGVLGGSLGVPIPTSVARSQCWLESAAPRTPRRLCKNLHSLRTRPPRTRPPRTRPPRRW